MNLRLALQGYGDQEVKARVMAKIPLDLIGGFEMLPRFIQVSDGLEMLYKRNTLNIHVVNGVALLTCASRDSLETYDRLFTDSTGIVPISFFYQHMVEAPMEKNEPAKETLEFDWDPPRN